MDADCCFATAAMDPARTTAAYGAHCNTPFRVAAPHLALGDGARVRGYVIERMIGRGGQGEVYCGRDTVRHRRIALKTLRAKWLCSVEARRRFREESAAALALEHPNIVRAFETFTECDRPFLVMEYVPGLTLSESLRQNALPLERRLHLFLICCEAVEFAHRRNVLHLDLKPQNVLLTPQGEPKIADFGNARPVLPEHRAANERVGGSPAYMAPEQASGCGHAISPRTDVYALGAMLYQMLTGCVPHTGDTPCDVVEQILTRDPPPPIAQDPRIPPRLNAVCVKALSREPADRHPSPALLADAVRNALDGADALSSAA